MKTILNIKTEKNLKEAAQEVAKDLGVPLTTAINVFLKQFVRDRELIISDSYKPSIYLRNILEEEKELNRKDIKVSDSVKSLMKDLDS